MGMYVILVAVMNMLVELLLLTGTHQLMRRMPNWRRILAGAALGGIYAGVCMLPQFHFLGIAVCRLAVLGAIAALVFGSGPGAAKGSCMFVLLSLSLGGMAQKLHRQDVFSALLAFAGLWILCWLDFCEEGQPETVEVSLAHNGRQVSVTALRDTGNTLRDPVTGQQVLILGADAAGVLTGLTRSQLSHPLETLASGLIPGLRLIPYRTVGQSCGMLLGMKIRECRVNGKGYSAVVAFAPEGLDEGNRYQALTGGVI